MIYDLGVHNDHPWVLGGDFNEVLRETEKRGGSGCDFNDICAFRDCLDTNGLREVEFTSHPYTWSNRRLEGLIEEKLDRCIANDDWFTFFPAASAENVI